jgi:gamma-glutamyltranspeptidase/glutathione hydrolase
MTYRLALSLLVLGFARVGLADTAVAERGMVASVHPLATKAGVEAFGKGGNAVDAAVATALTLGVVDAHNSGIGGGCFVLIHKADGSILCIDGREMAPAAAGRDMFMRRGKADTHLSQTGPLASGVPGSLLAYQQALDEAGKLKLLDLLVPAADLAASGFAIDEVWARKLKSVAGDLIQFPASAAQFLKPDGSLYEAGDVIRLPDLADSYRAIASQGVAWFYRGPFAWSVERWMKANGGILTAADFAAYHTVRRQPLITDYRGHRIIGMPPPSSGGVHVAQILNILSRFDLPRLSAADRHHVLAEAMKLAFADRAHWLGDPDFVKVPRGLVDPSYGRQLASRIRLDRAIEVPTHGQPPRGQLDAFERKHTTHIAAADAQGNWVAITATINTAFGSKVVVPGTGVVLNNQMDDFSVEPGVPNAFKLVGAEANAVAPRKRPLSSMSPTIILRDGKPIMTIGAAGGPTIITQVVQGIVRRIDLGDELDRALAGPRIHHQWAPDELRVEQALGEGLIRSLEDKGHTVRVTTALGSSNAVATSVDGTKLVGVSEPRVPGKAAGY